MSVRLRLSLLFALIVGAPAFAQKVVILEIDGDVQHKLRSQIEAAVKKAGAVETLSLQAYKDAAARKKLKGAAAFTPAGITRTAKVLKFDAAVTGEVAAGSYKVLILDRAGAQLWTKTLPVKRGLLSPEFAGKLARAIAAAANQGAAVAETPSQPSSDSEEGTGAAEQTGIDLTEHPKTEPRTPVQQQPHSDDPNHDTDLDKQAPKTVEVPGPPLIRGWLAGTTTWRSQCLRPGVANCKEYDLAATKPQGIVIDFTASVPYLGFLLSAELFPLARLRSAPIHRFINGLGLVGYFSFGQSLTRIVEATPQGQGAEKAVTSVDLGWAVQLAYRVHFAMGYGNPQPSGYAGLRGGLLSRNFNIDPTAGTSLPSSQRTYPTGIGFPVVGLDASMPIAPFFRVDLGVSLFFNPRTSAEQIIGYGNLNDPTGGATATGWSFDAGASGELFGPLGWMVRVRYTSFADRYYGQGQKWTVCNNDQCGGAGEEVFTQILWGVTGSF